MISELKTVAIRLGDVVVVNPITGGNTASANSVGGFIGNTMVYFLFPFAFLLSIILIAIGAFRIIISSGNPQAVASGRSMIINSIIGLTIISIAWALTAFISQSILKVYVT